MSNVDGSYLVSRRLRGQVHTAAGCGADVPANQRGALEGTERHEDASSRELRQAVPTPAQGAVRRADVDCYHR